MSPAAREALTVRVLDSLGCAFGALDGEVTRARYAPERIVRDDVQALPRRVTVAPDPGDSSSAVSQFADTRCLAP